MKIKNHYLKNEYLALAKLTAATNCEFMEWWQEESISAT